MKKALFTLILLLGLFLNAPSAAAQTAQTIPIHFFRGEGCPHCAAEEKYLQMLTANNADVTVKDYEVWYNDANRKLLINAADKLNAQVTGVPVTIIGSKVISGFDPAYTPQKIEDALNYCRDRACPDVVQEISVPAPTTSNGDRPDKITAPLWGEINLSALSLPAITVVIGLLDGFNPCAVWVLLFLISLLLGMKNRKRMWILGSTFIIVSGAVYFLFMAAWLNFLLFIGVVLWVRVIIALTALIAGGFNIREFLKNKDNACKVVNTDKRKRIFERLKDAAYQQKFLLALGGIIALAFAVNLVELFCSAGFPAVYTQILSMSNLPAWQYYLYLLGYIFFFMLDDLIVFALAMITLKATGLQSKYGRYSNIIGGILMIIIGLLLLFKPGWLMFG